MFDLTNKIVLIVGGRGYLGRDFCQALRSQNASVISADLPTQSQAASKSEFNNEFSDIEQVDVDVTDENSISKMVDLILEKYGHIDTLIYSVTAKPHDFYAPFTECSLEGWLSEGSNLAELYSDEEEKKQKGQIYSHSVYPVVKGGVISLTRYLAAYWGGRNIRVNCISPGGVYHEGENETFVKKYSAKVPLGRKAEVREISGAVVYLASDESSYVTGQNIIVDGGWTAW